MRKIIPAALLALVLVVPAQAEDKWVTIKGQVVWAGGPIPKRSPIKIVRCIRPAKKGELLDKEYVINPKNKGVQWVQVYLGALVDGKYDPTAPMPTHPDLKSIKDKQVVIDQPCCEFEPHVVGLRVGQALVVKNSSATDAHNSNIQGDGKRAPAKNPLLPPATSKEFQDPWTPHAFAIPISCSIHPWMKAWVRVFNHPYHTVTDADGNFEIKLAPSDPNVRLVMWHETEGWFAGAGRNGLPLKKPDANGVIDLGQIKMIPE